MAAIFTFGVFLDMHMMVGMLLLCVLLKGNTKRDFSRERYLLDLCPVSISYFLCYQSKYSNSILRYISVFIYLFKTMAKSLWCYILIIYIYCRQIQRLKTPVQHSGIDNNHFWLCTGTSLLLKKSPYLLRKNQYLVWIASLRAL